MLSNLYTFHFYIRNFILLAGIITRNIDSSKISFIDLHKRHFNIFINMPSFIRWIKRGWMKFDWSFLFLFTSVAWCQQNVRRVSVQRDQYLETGASRSNAPHGTIPTSSSLQKCAWMLPRSIVDYPTDKNNVCLTVSSHYSRTIKDKSKAKIGLRERLQFLLIHIIMQM